MGRAGLRASRSCGAAAPRAAQWPARRTHDAVVAVRSGGVGPRALERVIRLRLHVGMLYTAAQTSLWLLRATDTAPRASNRPSRCQGTSRHRAIRGEGAAFGARNKSRRA